MSSLAAFVVRFQYIQLFVNFVISFFFSLFKNLRTRKKFREEEDRFLSRLITAVRRHSVGELKTQHMRDRTVGKQFVEECRAKGQKGKLLRKLGKEASAKRL